MTSDDILAFYASHGPMSDPGSHHSALAELPANVRELLPIIQGITIYDVVAPSFYGFEVPQDRLAELHIRGSAARLKRIAELDPRPLLFARPPERRVLGRCAQFTLLLVTVLRAKGVPARARCGFGAYFNRPRFEDHWVCEYWNQGESRWVLADAQFDAIWRERLAIHHDVADVPRNQFVTAADAWRRCRDGRADPSLFGISFVGLYGLWFIAGSLVRDLAAVNKVEMLPWDIWGCQPQPGKLLEPKELALFDELAQLTGDPDTIFRQLRHRYGTDDNLHVPAAVFNALRHTIEAVPELQREPLT